MAILHRATIQPSKLELIADWLPSRSWYPGEERPQLQRVAASRFDDPDGEVGIETMLVQADGGPLIQVPLTYRGAPLEGAQEWLIGTTEHSVLGRRWVYDACGDPVYARMLAETIGGAAQAEEYLDDQRREPDMSVAGSGGPLKFGAVVRVQDGDPAVIVTDTAELTVARLLDRELAGPSESRLTGTWTGQPVPRVLAFARSI